MQARVGVVARRAAVDAGFSRGVEFQVECLPLGQVDRRGEGHGVIEEETAAGDGLRDGDRCRVVVGRDEGFVVVGVGQNPVARGAARTRESERHAEFGGHVLRQRERQQEVAVLAGDHRLGRDVVVRALVGPVGHAEIARRAADGPCREDGADVVILIFGLEVCAL